MYTILFLAFPDDFAKSISVDGCKEPGDDILKRFTCTDTAPSQIINKSFARNECELYCSTDKNCWGCRQVCHNSCQWNAVKDCTIKENSENGLEALITQKTGNSHRTIFEMEERY